MFYFKEVIPCKVLANQTVSPNVEMMAIEFHQNEVQMASLRCL